MLTQWLPKSLRMQVKQSWYRWPKLCPEVRAWAEETRLAEIVRVDYEAHTRERCLPDKSVSDVPVSFLAHTHYPLRDRTLFRIPNVRIRGQDGILVLPDGSVSRQTAWDRVQILGSSGYQMPASLKGIRKQGNWFSLILYWGTGYYHWFNDVLSLLYRNLEALAEDTRFIVPVTMREVHWRSLELLGVPRERCVVFTGEEIWELETLWYQPPASHDQTPGAPAWVGAKIREGLGVRKQDLKARRLYISRGLARKRGVANEEELVPLLRDHGFGIIRSETLSFDEQVAAFASAECVIGAHGAGLVNMIFSAPGTRVLELFASSECARRCYWTLSAELGMDYHCLIGDPGNVRDDEADICISVENLQAALVKLNLPI